MIFRCKCSKHQGFTLLEVIIALSIFTIGILGVLGMQIRSIQGNSSGQRLTEAASQAQEIIEDLTERPFNDFVAGAAPYPRVSNTTSGIFRVRRTIAQMPPPSSLTTSEAIWVTATVTWTEAGGLTRSMSISFIKSKNMETSYES